MVRLTFLGWDSFYPSVCTGTATPISLRSMSIDLPGLEDKTGTRIEVDDFSLFSQPGWPGRGSQGEGKLLGS